ncbi:hypothetical protein [Moellerella wisconsensis]|uniref:hypothetical protein n=1 Tax=Moellerella wisconsensis TaxID=158849 RepID=UPI0006B49125|nr:hypothetical protein [Moellerella wisconsensis]VFS52311.1 Uncharacterised protein [Moellerella wisconsensis]
MGAKTFIISITAINLLAKRLFYLGYPDIIYIGVLSALAEEQSETLKFSTTSQTLQSAATIIATEPEALVISHQR